MFLRWFPLLCNPFTWRVTPDQCVKFFTITTVTCFSLVQMTAKSACTTLSSASVSVCLISEKLVVQSMWLQTQNIWLPLPPPLAFSFSMLKQERLSQKLKCLDYKLSKWVLLLETSSSSSCMTTTEQATSGLWTCSQSLIMLKQARRMSLRLFKRSKDPVITFLTLPNGAPLTRQSLLQPLRADLCSMMFLAARFYRMSKFTKARSSKFTWLTITPCLLLARETALLKFWIEKTSKQLDLSHTESHADQLPSVPFSMTLRFKNST